MRSVRNTDLAFQVEGQITEWNVIDGARFQRGGVIARLDARSFEAALDQAEAQYTNADSEYQCAPRLIKEDAISRSAVENREAQWPYAEGEFDLINVLNIQQRLFAAERNLVTIRRVRIEQWAALNLALGGDWNRTWNGDWHGGGGGS